jgi:hypothetical protein
MMIPVSQVDCKTSSARDVLPVQIIPDTLRHRTKLASSRPIDVERSEEPLQSFVAVTIEAKKLFADLDDTQPVRYQTSLSDEHFLWS